MTSEKVTFGITGLKSLEVKSLKCAAEMMHRQVELLAVAAQRKK